MSTVSNLKVSYSNSSASEGKGFVTQVGKGSVVKGDPTGGYVFKNNTGGNSNPTSTTCSDNSNCASGQVCDKTPGSNTVSTCKTVATCNPATAKGGSDSAHDECRGANGHEPFTIGGQSTVCSATGVCIIDPRVPNGANSCANDNGCTANLYCNNGACISGCASNLACDTGSWCDTNATPHICKIGCNNKNNNAECKAKLNSPTAYCRSTDHTCQIGG